MHLLNPIFPLFVLQVDIFRFLSLILYFSEKIVAFSQLCPLASIRFNLLFVSLYCSLLLTNFSVLLNFNELKPIGAPFFHPFSLRETEKNWLRHH
jgi:hypothetical protein